MMSINKTSQNRITTFLKDKAGVVSIEMAVLLVPMIFAGMFTFDIARAYIISSSLDGAAIDLATRARAGQLTNVTSKQFCKEFNMSFCDMDKIGVRIEPLASSDGGTDPSPGEFSIVVPGDKLSMLVRVSYHIDPMFRFERAPETFVMSAGAFTYVY